MANNKDINAIFEDIINNAQSVAVAAVKNASKQVQKEVCEQAEKNLQAYYKSYSPVMYQRTNKLRRAILPYYADRSNSKHIRIEVGVQYNASALIGAYKSNSWYHQGGDEWISRDYEDFKFNSRNNGIPGPDWILDNFLEGFHPVTKLVNQGGGDWEYEYRPVKTKSQYSLMKKFFDTVLMGKINGYVNAAIENAILSKFK